MLFIWKSKIRKAEMAKCLVYYCPKDHDVVLFTEKVDDHKFGWVGVPIPKGEAKQCKKCREYYYKSECDKVEENR